MRRYLAKRLLQAIPILLGVSIVVYSIMIFTPGDPFSFYLNPDLDPAAFQRMAEELGLNKPWYVQYWMWLKEVLQGNLGYSIHQLKPVTSLIFQRLGGTLMLTGTAYVLAMLIAIPLGVITATRQYSVFDYAVSGLAFLGISLPSFFAALLAAYFFGVVLEWFPLSGMMTPGVEFNIWDRLHHMALPVLTLMVRDMTGLVRFTRSSMLEVLRQDYVRTARAKGLVERVVLFKHAFRNGALPLVTILGLSLPDLFSGALILETIFVWPGIGRLAFESLLTRDYPIIIGINMMLASMVIIGSLAADLLYAVADPRIRYT